MTHGAAFAAVAIQINAAALGIVDGVAEDLIVSRAINSNHFPHPELTKCEMAIHIELIIADDIVTALGIKVQGNGIAAAVNCAVAHGEASGARTKVEGDAPMPSDGHLIEHCVPWCRCLRPCGVAERGGAFLNALCFTIATKTDGANGTIDLAASNGDIAGNNLQLSDFPFVKCFAVAVNVVPYFDGFVSRLFRRRTASKK